MLEPTQNGGLTAPPPRGLSASRRPPRMAARPRRKTARGQAIGKAIARAQAAQGPPQGGQHPLIPGVEPPALPMPPPPRRQHPAPGRPGGLVGARALRPPQGGAVDSAVQADLGRQLSRRVAAGAIDQGQAEKVAQDRALLESAYGPDWRVKLFGGKGKVQHARQSLADNPQDPQAKALYDQLMRQRASALERAKRKRTPARAGQSINPNIVY